MPEILGASELRQIFFKRLLAALEFDVSKPTPDWMKEFLKARTEAVLRQWADGKLNAQIANHLPNQLATPLQHKYSKRNLSFEGLESEDCIVAEVLRNCKNSATQEPLLEVYLCTLTLELTGFKEPGSPNYDYCEAYIDMGEGGEEEGEESEVEEEEEEEEEGEEDDEADHKEGEDVDEEDEDSKSTSSEEDHGFTMAQLESEDLSADHWIGWNGEPVDGMTIASRDIVVRNVDDVWTGCFGKTPYKSKYHTGQQEYYFEEGCLQLCFRKATIVVQPRKTRSDSAIDERDGKRMRLSSCQARRQDLAVPIRNVTTTKGDVGALERGRLELLGS